MVKINESDTKEDKYKAIQINGIMSTYGNFPQSPKGFTIYIDDAEKCPLFMIEAQKTAAKAHMLDFLQLKLKTESKTSNKAKQSQIDDIINSLVQFKQSNPNINSSHNNLENLNNNYEKNQNN